VFGSAAERELCEAVAAGLRGGRRGPRNLAGAPRSGEFIDLAAALRLYLTNDSEPCTWALRARRANRGRFSGATDDATTAPPDR